MYEEEYRAMNISDVLTRHPRHPSLIHLKKYNVKERKKLFEKVQEGSPFGENTNKSDVNLHSIQRKSTQNNGTAYKSKLLNVCEEDEILVDANSNHISSVAAGLSASSRSVKICANRYNDIVSSKSNSFAKEPTAASSCTNLFTTAPPLPVFTSRFSSHLRQEYAKEKKDRFSHLSDAPFKSTLISKVVWTGLPEPSQEKSDESESGVFLNEPDGTSDDNSVTPTKSFAPSHSSLSKQNSISGENLLRKASDRINCDSASVVGDASRTVGASPARPALPPKPPRLLEQLSYTQPTTKADKPKRSSSMVYEYLTNTHSANLPQFTNQKNSKVSTFPTRSSHSPPDQRSPDGLKKPDSLDCQARESTSSIPQDLFLCKAAGVAGMKEKFERRSTCSEASSSGRSLLIKKSADEVDSKKNPFVKASKSKKFVSKKFINNPSYEYVRADDFIPSRTTQRLQSRVTFQDEREEAGSSTRCAKFSTSTSNDCARQRSYPLNKKFGSIHDEQWRKQILDREEPTYADPRSLGRRHASQNNVALDAAGYAIPSHESSPRFIEEEEDAEDVDDKSIYMRGFSKEERIYLKSKVSDAYSILRTGNNLCEEVPISFMTRSVSAGNVSRGGSASEPSDFLEHERRLNYVSAIRRLTFKNVSKYEEVKSNLNVKLFEYALVVGLRPPTCNDDDDDVGGRKEEEEEEEDDDGVLTNSSKTEVLFAWPENLSESDQLTSNFCFPDVDMWQTNAQLSGDMFCFFLTTSTGDRKFCWCLRYMPPDSNMPEAVCVVSAVGEAGFYQQLLNSVREARQHSLELAEETIKSAHSLKLPRPNKELYVNAMDHEGFRYTGVLKRMTESHYSTAKFGALVHSLPISLLIQVVAAVLLERRVILLAERLSTLSSCIMSLSTLLYPFTWPHTLITVLPPSLLELVHSPTPYILGMFSSYRHLLDEDQLDEVLVVDLDDGFFVRSVGDESRILPKKIQKALMLALLDVPRDDFARSSVITDVTLTEAFLRMFVETCAHYGDFISYSPTTGNTFQAEEFVKAVSSNSIRLFLDWFTRTQMFQVFIHDKMKESAISDLFDQRIEEYRREMDSSSNVANMKLIRSKFVNFFKNYGTKLKKTLKKSALV